MYPWEKSTKEMLFFAFLTLIGIVSGSFLKMESMIKREDFVLQSKADSDADHEIVFAIKQKNLDKLESMVLERSTPGNPLYQKWMTFNEVGELVSNPAAFELTTNFLSAHNVKVTWVATRKEYLKASAPVAVWEKLLDTTFHNWKDQSPHTDDKGLHIRAEHYSLPEELVGHVDYVFNAVDPPPVIHRKYHRKEGNTAYRTDYTPNLRRVKESLAAAEAEVRAKGLEGTAEGSTVTTVAFLNQFYAIPSNNGSSALSQSVFETASEYFSQNDLNTFQNTYGTTVQEAIDEGGYETATCSTGNVGHNCDEGNLDIQYIMGIAQYTASTYWYVSGSNAFVTWITDLASDPNPPTSNSMSWGSIEQQTASSTLNSFNTEAMKLGAIGVTVTISSGDNGVANSGCGCTTSSSSSSSSWTGAGSWTGQGYFPNFPASCPYVTALGATMGANGYPPAVGGEELACQSQLGGVITSGGGFSTYYAQPSWQTSAVNTYFNGLTTQPAPGYNRNGRAIPDMAMLGVYYQVIIAGQPTSLFGTSCSSPVTAALVSLINAARATKGLGTVGFMNPTLYANEASFTDVTSGSNNCCEYGGSTPSAATCCTSGFTATAGWDPVTGLGSIQYPKLAALFGL